MSFIYCHLNFQANLLRPWPFPLNGTFLSVDKLFNIALNQAPCGSAIPRGIKDKYILYLTTKRTRNEG